MTRQIGISLLESLMSAPSLSALDLPTTDPTPIFEFYRGNYATELLTAAVAHFNLFERLAPAPLTAFALRTQIGLAQRPAVVLFTALRAMGLLATDKEDRLSLSDVARQHLVPDTPFDVSDYIGLAANNPGVLAMVERLRANQPAGAKPNEPGAAFIYRAGIASAMEQEATARHLTLALAGRAKSVAPFLAERFPLNQACLLLDIGGGTGIYSIAWLQKHPQLRAVVWDRPEVLKVAAELAQAYGVSERLDCRPGDMFVDPLPEGADVMLLSNILHDWDIPQCRALIGRCAATLPPGGQLLIHDVFLNDALDGPLTVALYSAALFCLTEGRAYSATEYRAWLSEARLGPGTITPTAVHCGVLPGVKRSSAL
jgi:hypothetical protein